MQAITPDPDDRFIDPDRLDRIRTTLAGTDLDAFVTFAPENSYYLSGCYAGMYSRPVAAVVTRETSVFVGPWLELAKAERTAWVDQAVVYEDADDPFAVLADAVPDGIDRAGIDKAYARPKWVRELDARIGAALVDATDQFLGMRAVKTDWEIDMIRRSRDLARAGIDQFIDSVRSGTTELEVVAEMQRAFYDTYLERYPKYDIGTANELGQYGFASVLTGEHGLEPHSIASAREIESGHSVVAISLPSIHGYVCEEERTVLVGDIPDVVVEAMETLVEVRETTMDMVEGGARADEIDEWTATALREAGYGDNLVHRTGHGEGITIHEGPVLNAREPATLEPGMVISVEPGLYFPDGGIALRHSDTFVVTEGGAERLTGADDGVLRAS